MLSVLLIRTASTTVAATSATQSSATTSNATGPTEGTTVYLEESSPQGECIRIFCSRVSSESKRKSASKAYSTKSF
jgi:hypothetical protein